MKKYGVHWGRHVLGVYLGMLSFYVWVGLLLQMSWPQAFSPVQMLLTPLAFNVLLFLGTRENAKNREQAAKNPERMAFDKPVFSSHMGDRSTLFPFLRKVIGVSWAFVGIVTITTHALFGTIGLVTALVSTVVFPVLFTAALYLLGTASVPETRGEMGTVKPIQSLTPVSLDTAHTALVAEDAAATITLRQQ